MCFMCRRCDSCVTLTSFFSPPPFNTSLLFLCLSIFISFFHIFSHYIPPSSTPFQLKLAVMFSLYSSLPLSVFISFSPHRFQPWPLSAWPSLRLNILGILEKTVSLFARWLSWQSVRFKCILLVSTPIFSHVPVLHYQHL